MSRTFILNASPVILLGKAGLLSTVSPLATRWVIPDRVVAEVEAKRQIGHYWVRLLCKNRGVGISKKFLPKLQQDLETVNDKLGDETPNGVVLSCSMAG